MTSGTLSVAFSFAFFRSFSFIDCLLCLYAETYFSSKLRNVYNTNNYKTLFFRFPNVIHRHHGIFLMEHLCFNVL